MGILEMDFERILVVPFFHSSSHSIMLWSNPTTKFLSVFVLICIESTTILKELRFVQLSLINNKFHPASLLIYLVNQQAGWHF